MLDVAQAQDRGMTLQVCGLGTLIMGCNSLCYRYAAAQLSGIHNGLLSSKYRRVSHCHRKTLAGAHLGLENDGLWIIPCLGVRLKHGHG